jgi:hypothetical protein
MVGAFEATSTLLGEGSVVFMDRAVGAIDEVAAGMAADDAKVVDEAIIEAVEKGSDVAIFGVREGTVARPVIEAAEGSVVL